MAPEDDADDIQNDRSLSWRSWSTRVPAMRPEDIDTFVNIRNGGGIASIRSRQLLCHGELQRMRSRRGSEGSASLPHEPDSDLRLYDEPL